MKLTLVNINHDNIPHLSRFSLAQDGNIDFAYLWKCRSSAATSIVFARDFQVGHGQNVDICR